ncbi:hypothetical protein [Paraglaciecola sp. 2405UD69-4]|uniref:hypothetical protein n=1 Tax=Paraglaciecola sp. 2405UD69-4 TaxID=3391836 RepID=UPI0039C9AA67
MLFKPTNWKGWGYFTADDYGMHFPSSPSPSDKPEFLYVSWGKVENIEGEKLYGRVYGVSIELNISQREVEQHFSQVYKANKLLDFKQMRGEYFLIAYPNNAFQKLPVVVNRLLEIKAASI